MHSAEWPPDISRFSTPYLCVANICVDTERVMKANFAKQMTSSAQTPQNTINSSFNRVRVARHGLQMDGVYAVILKQGTKLDKQHGRIALFS
jgi:hypothetical protein